MTTPLILYQPEYVTDTNSNGGRMTDKLVIDTVNGAGNFSSVTKPERIAGVTKARKLFIKIADVTNPLATQGTVFLKAPSLSTDSRTYLVKGTQRDQQAAIGSRKYATGILQTGVSIGATVLVVNFEAGSGADLVVQAGDKIAVISGATENLDLYASAVSWSTDQATITLTTGVLNAFSAGAAVAACILDTTDINSGFDNVVKSFTGTTFDLVTHPLLTNNVGTDEQTLLFTVTSSTTFSCISDKHGLLPAGSMAVDYSPVNAAFSLPYFTLTAAGWGGTPTIGDTMQVQIHPAAIPVWVVQKTSAGAAGGLDAAYPSVRLEV